MENLLINVFETLKAQKIKGYVQNDWRGLTTMRGEGRMSVKLYIKDNTNGHIHEYGTNQHDSLILMEDGSIHYENLQNACGTMFPDEGYSFCLADGTDPRTREDYIKHGCESYLDIGGTYYAENKLKGGKI